MRFNRISITVDSMYFYLIKINSKLLPKYRINPALCKLIFDKYRHLLINAT